MADWTTNELRAATRAYLWMLRSASSGNMPNKTAVRRALVSGPLSGRNEKSLEFRFRNISYVLDQMGKKWLKGYLPAENVGPGPEAELRQIIKELEEGDKSQRRVSFLVSGLPEATVERAASELASGRQFEYAESTTYDAVLSNGTKLAPKAVIGYAGFLHYRAPLTAEDFSGGDGTPCFERLKAAGLTIVAKSQSAAEVETLSEPESPEFREEVKKQKSRGFAAPPIGNKKPKKVATTTTTFVRDPAVVAYVEQRANGRCEHCGRPAPFLRPDGSPYMEVHHIIPLSEDGEDTAKNAAALCPNCHRECHHGLKARAIRQLLVAKITVALQAKA